MNYNTDGFNERSIYIHNSNDMNRLNQNGPSNFDNSFAKMKVEENRSDVKTVDTDVNFRYEEAKGNKENFVLRNNNMRNVNTKPNMNNPVAQALNRNMFKR